MRKRILSILLCLVMVVGLFPTMAFAADGSGATTGSGTKSDPYCVSTYAEMKDLLQTPASYYIKVVGMDNDSSNEGVPIRRLIAGRDFESTKPAIDIPSGAHHHLEIATDIWFIADQQDGDKNIFSRLIDVVSGSSLEITGTGSLRVEVNALTVKNAIIDNWGGELTIDGSVTLNGIQDFRSNVATRPIWIDGGVTNIKGGYIYGHNNMKATSDEVTSTISFGDKLAKGTELNISGGTIKQVNNATNQGNENSCALYVDDDKAANAIHLTGGTFEGGMKMANGKSLSELLDEGYQFYNMSENTVFDGSVSKTQKKLIVTPTGVNPTVINKVSLTVKSLNERKTLSDLACSYSPNNKMVLDNFVVFKGLNNERDKIEDQNTPYDPKQSYTVMYVFEANEGFSYSSDIKSNVSVSGGDFWKADTFGGTTILRVFVNFPASAIDKVSLTIKPENERKTISDLACSYSPESGMTLKNFSVYKGLNNTSDKIEGENTPYDPNQSYTAMYVFNANVGFYFSSNLKDNLKDNVTVTGGDFWMADTFGGLPNIIRVFVNFPATSTAGQEVKTVTIQVKPKAERNALNDFACQSYTPTGSMGSPAYFVRAGLNTDGTGSTPASYDKNNDYSVVYEFPIKPGCTIAEDISTDDVTINDGQVWKVSSDSEGKNLLVYVNFPKDPTTDPNYVTEAAVQVAAPVAGEHPNGPVYLTVTSGNADKFETALMFWFGMNDSDTFEVGKEYTANVYLKPKAGVTLADDMKLKINGKDAKLVMKDDSDGSVQFQLKIAAVAPSAPTTYDVTVTSGSAAPYADVAPGTKVTLTANAPETGKVFDKWVVLEGNVTLADATKATTTFTMPSHNVTVAATYKPIAHTHTFDQEIIKDAALKTAADCTHDAVYYKSCSCGAISTDDADTFTAINSALGHAWPEEGSWSKDADKHWYECSRCHLKKDEAAHDYGDDDICDICTYDNSVPHTHNLTLVDENPATCTTPGNKAYYTCDGCDKWFEDATGSVEITDKTSVILTANGHTPSGWKSDADNHWKECTVVGCGVIIEDSKAAHTASDWIIDTEATATTDGTKHKECNVCKRELETGTIPATGSGEHTHSYGSDWKSDANKHWHECSCGAKAEEAAHTASKWITDTAATATTDGTKHKECTVCHRVLETGTIPATGSGEHTHSYSSDWKSDSINHWKECSCGHKDDVAAHSFKWVVDKEATATKKGTKHEECKVCGYQRPAVEIPATGSTTKPTDPTESNPNTGALDDVPQTGDNSNMILWIVLLLASGLGVTGTVVYSKRKKYVK